MQTAFTAAQLTDPGLAEVESILRKCVHCGFCNATCPTYTLLGDELDGPRGRIYLIADMLEGGKPASDRVVTHVDRCLSCLACNTTCPSGVNYMHLVDRARVHIEETAQRRFADRLLRNLLVALLPHPRRLRPFLALAGFARSLGVTLPGRLGAMLRLAPRTVAGPSPVDTPQVFRAEGHTRMRVVLLSGCVQQAVAPQINEATVRLFTRLGAEVVIAENAGCCGALEHHMGREDAARDHARRNIAAWEQVAGGPIDAVIANASGCGTQLKTYGHLLQQDAGWAARAAKISGLARDVTEVLAQLGLRATSSPPLRVAYHAACSLQHGQRVTREPKALLADAGFTVVEPAEAHLCCGSAGSYNILQPDIARTLGKRKAANLDRLRPDVIATGNVGCITQLATVTGTPVVHTVELLDWATGGPKPGALLS
jgi:glycolate oxidase iron-sulfur subunit